MSLTIVWAHGSGSTTDFVERSIVEPVRHLRPDWRVLPCAQRSGDVSDVCQSLLDLADGAGGRVVLGGLSLGAHAAVLAARQWNPLAVSSALEAVIACMPGWTGEPDEVAALTQASAERIRSEGTEALLAELDPQDWVTRELRLGWAQYASADLAAAFGRTAHSPGPTLEEVSGLRAPLLAIALDCDPLHPSEVAESWASSARGSVLEMLDRDEPRDVAAFGRAVVRGLSRLGL